MNKWPKCKKCEKYFPPTTSEQIINETCKDCIQQLEYERRELINEYMNTPRFQ